MNTVNVINEEAVARSAGSGCHRCFTLGLAPQALRFRLLRRLGEKVQTRDSLRRDIQPFQGSRFDFRQDLYHLTAPSLL
jgi:hypothetical protein